MFKNLVNVRTYMIHSGTDSGYGYSTFKFIKFPTGYYDNVISGYKYTEYNIITLTQYRPKQIIYDLSSSLTVKKALLLLKKSEMYNVNTNVIFRGFLVLYKSY